MVVRTLGKEGPRKFRIELKGCAPCGLAAGEFGVRFGRALLALANELLGCEIIDDFSLNKLKEDISA